MISCSVALERILEADIADLRPGRGSELATHLADCASCQAAAASVLEGTSALGELVESGAAAPWFAQQRRPSTGLKVGVSLATAAILSALFIGGGLITGRLSPGSPPPNQVKAMLPVVEEAPGSQVAIFATKDPSITIIWLTREEIQ